MTESEIALEFKRQFLWTAFKVLEFNGIDGDYAEFGVRNGKTFRLAFDQIRARSIKRHMWAFDSWKGLPAPTSELDAHPMWQEGRMSTDLSVFQEICRAHGIPQDAYTAIPGFFRDTLSHMPADAAPKNIALAYIDCDMYSSTKTVLEFLVPRLKHGMLLAFDDYFCWSATGPSGEKAALEEVLAGDRKWKLERYRDYGWGGTSFVVEWAR